MGTKPTLTHITGCFLIEAPASFLNGAGLGEGENRNVSIVKTFRDGRDRVPYVSSQAWRRWLRNTLIEETGWKPSVLRAISLNRMGNTEKIGSEFNPVDFPEDDIFGYMRTEKGGTEAGEGASEMTEGLVKGDEENENKNEKTKRNAAAVKGKRVRALARASPFSSSILVSIRRSGWQGRDQAWVHLKEGTALPYTTEFYNTHLQGIFCLNYSRLGVFSNIGDRIELDESMIGELIKSNRITVKSQDENGGKVFELTDAVKLRRERASALFRSLAVLRGGAKQAAFGTDVSPKAIVLTGLSSGNPVFNGVFKDEEAAGPMLNIGTLKEVVRDYAKRVVTPVFVGIRKGYLKNEDEVYAINDTEIDGVTIRVTTPIEAADLMAKQL